MFVNLQDDSANCKYYIRVNDWEDYLANESLKRAKRKGVKDYFMETDICNKYWNDDKFKRDLN
jgi:retron-type reverse transcriptase